jgi:hypothetical protein
MDQPTYVPPSFPTQPIAPPPRRGLSTGAKVGMAAAFLFAFITMGVLSRAVVRRLIVARAASQIDSLDPYTFMTRDYTSSPDRFRRAVVRGAEIGMRRNAPTAHVTFDEAVVTDLRQALRAVVPYRGEVQTANGTATVDGQQRQYIHRKGAIVVETVCVTNNSFCAGRDELIERTDAAVLAHLNDDEVDGIIPPDGDCQPQVMRTPGRINRMTLCKIEGDIVMTIMKLNLAETRSLTRTFLQDPEVQRMSKDLERETP